MKAKKTVVCWLLLAAFMLLFVPAAALADGTYGGLAVTGGTENTDYSYVGNSLTILTGTPLTLSGSTSTTKVIINTNVTANLTLQDASIDARSLGAAIHLYGGTTLNLTVLGNNTLRSGTNLGGIDVTSGKTLVITEASTGTLNVTGGYDGAGIGGGNGASCGNITIWSGTIHATGNHDSAGIGGGNSGSGGTIVIRGGTIKATGGSAASSYDGSGAGIGGGYAESGGNITISGGYVEAKSTRWAAGIGGGGGGDGGTIIIDGGTVKATGNSCGAGIGGGIGGAGGNITINGGTVEAVAYYGGAGIGGGDSGNGGTVKVTGGVVFANSAAGTHDVGPGAPYDDEVLTGSLTLSGTAALFLKHDTCVSPTTSTHKHINAIGHTAGASVYGYPVTWSGNFGGYLFGYSLSYELNSGVVSPDNPPFYGPKCDSLTLRNPVRPGYTFDGWTGTDIAGLSGSVTITPDLTGDRAYIANWTPNTYTVNYNANSGTGITTASIHTYNAAKALTVNGFVKACYTFAGWATDAGGAVIYGNAENVSNLTAENGGTLTLYAKWAPYTYTVNYNANGGTGVTGSSSHAYDEAKVLTVNTFTRAGYTFAGWATSADGAAVYHNAESVINLTTENGGMVTLYAKWTPNTYTVSYDANDGVGTTEASSHTYDAAKVLTLNGFTKAYHNFTGWATDASGAVVYGNAESVLNLSAENGGMVTLYAKWAPYTYTVSYNANGGKGTTETSSHIYGEAKALTSNGFTRKGYAFAGWATGLGGAAVYYNGQSVIDLTAVDLGTVTLYAVWIEDDEPTSDSLGTVANCISGVNVRRGPGTSYSILGVAPKGAKYSITGQTGAWYKVNFAGVEGYISARYLSAAAQASQPASPMAESGQGTVVNCNRSVNIRSGPGVQYSILGFAPKGAAYTITGQSGAWYKIDFEGKAGYISADYFAASASLPASTAGEQGRIVNCNFSVNVRSGPGTEYSILGFARKGAVYTIIDKSGAWYKIEFNGMTAYISASYFSSGNE